MKIFRQELLKEKKAKKLLNTLMFLASINRFPPVSIFRDCDDIWSVECNPSFEEYEIKGQGGNLETAVMGLVNQPALQKCLSSEESKIIERILEGEIGYF